MIPSQPTRRPGRPPKTRTWSGNATTPALIEIGFLELIRFLESASTQACVVHTLYIFSAVAAKQNRVYEASGHSKQGGVFTLEIPKSNMEEIRRRTATEDRGFFNPAANIGQERMASAAPGYAQ